MANRWENIGYSDRLYFLGLEITADGDCSHEIKRHLLLGRKAMTNLEILKSRDVTLPTKVHIVKVVIFPVVVYECVHWTIKKAKCWRTDAFELWCWRRLLRVPWSARRSNQSILKEINPEHSLEGLMLKCQHFWLPDAKSWLIRKCQHFWLPDAKSWLIRKDLDAGKDWRQEEKGMTARDGWMASLTQWTSLN